MSEPLQTVLVLVAGFFTGMLSGMFGVGGAVVSTPAIRALGATPIEAIGSTLPSIIPSAISGSMRYQRDGLVHWRVVLWTALVGCAAAVGGALLADVVPGNGHLLMVLTALLLMFTAYRTGRSPARPDPADAEEPAPAHDPDFADAAAPAGPPRTEWWRLAVIGLAAGLLSGLLGVGGGIIMVPAFASWVRLPIKEAVGCSLACVGILAVPGTITHQLLGHIDWAFALPLCIAVIPGARVGAHLAIRSSERGLRLSVAIVLGSIAVIYAAGELWALR
ncbi:MAG TPA: sulfite exporter TauE/SafE family protein [Acidimicrobiia bacterium]